MGEWLDDGKGVFSHALRPRALGPGNGCVGGQIFYEGVGVNQQCWGPTADGNSTAAACGPRDCGGGVFSLYIPEYRMV